MVQRERRKTITRVSLLVRHMAMHYVPLGSHRFAFFVLLRSACKPACSLKDFCPARACAQLSLQEETADLAFSSADTHG